MYPTRSSSGRSTGVLDLARRYRKFLAAAAGAIGTVIAPQVTGDYVASAYEWGNVVYSCLGAIAVLGVSNYVRGPWQYTKAIIMGMTAFAVLTLGSVTGAGLIPGEWWQFVVLVVATVAVGRVPNAPRRETST